MQRQICVIRTPPSAQGPNIVDHRRTGRTIVPLFRPLRRGTWVIAVIVLTAACEDRAARVGPSAPTAAFTVSGTVSESTSAGLTPVGGVGVRAGRSSRWAATDGSGFFSISGVPGSNITLTTQKADYVSTTTQVNVSEDVRVDLLVRPIAAQTLSGVVFETTESGRVGVGGVSIYCDSCGSPVGHTFATTDAAGRYSFSWADNGATQLIVSKDGYWVLGPSAPEFGGRIVALVQGDTRFDIELVRR